MIFFPSPQPYGAQLPGPTAARNAALRFSIRTASKRKSPRPILLSSTPQRSIRNPSLRRSFHSRPSTRPRTTIKTISAPFHRTHIVINDLPKLASLKRISQPLSRHSSALSPLPQPAVVNSLLPYFLYFLLPSSFTSFTSFYSLYFLYFLTSLLLYFLCLASDFLRI